MEFNVNKLRSSVQQLLALLSTNEVVSPKNKFLHEFLQLKKYSPQNVENLLQNLSEKLLDEEYTEPIAISFEYCILLILTDALKCDEAFDDEHFGKYQCICIALAKLMIFSVDTRRYCMRYFRDKPAPFHIHIHHTEPKSKKTKNNEKKYSPDRLSIIRCCYHFLTIDTDFFKSLWDWSPFIVDYIQKSKNSDLSNIYCYHIMAILTNMSSKQLSILTENIPDEVFIKFDSNENKNFNRNVLHSYEEKEEQNNIVTLDLNLDLVTNIEGVLLPIFNHNNYKFYSQYVGHYDKIVRVDSTKVNLRSLALGVSSAKAICLTGPVGCGKTTLVEYLARQTGRVCPKQNEITQHSNKENENSKDENSFTQNRKNKICLGNKRKTDFGLDTPVNIVDETYENDNGDGFLRIQLGDQTDSKMLLGQYRCTDVPGEFIWLPGVLTQAVMNGYWLLLEDLDSATQDTYTILSGLLENNFLSVPGFRDNIKVEPGFQLFVTVRTNKSSSTSGKKSLYSLLEKYLYTINIMPLSRNELCKVISMDYPKLATVANRIVDVFLTFSSGDHTSADNLRQQETGERADNTEKFIALPFEEILMDTLPNAGRLVSTRDLIKLCKRSDPVFSVTSTECAYFVFQNAVDVFCSYLPQGNVRTKFIISIGAKLGIIQSRCEFFANDYKPEVAINSNSIQVGRAELCTKQDMEEIENDLSEEENELATDIPKKRLKLSNVHLKSLIKKPATFSFTRIATCILERIAVCIMKAEPVLLVGETGVGKTSSVQYLAERTHHKLVVVNMNNQSDVSDLVGGFKPVDLSYVITPLRSEFEQLFCITFKRSKNEAFLTKFAICFSQCKFHIAVQSMLSVINSVLEKNERDELKGHALELIPRWQILKVKLYKLHMQLSKSINISFAFIPGSLVNCIKNGDWVLLDEINLASAETLECLSTILEPDGSIVLLEKGDFTPVKRHPDFRIFACMNPNTDIGKKDLPVGIRNRFTEFFVDELTTDSDLTLLVSDYLSNSGIQRKSVSSIVKLYKKLKQLSKLELNDGLGNRPVFSLRTLCRSLRICAKNLCGSIERNLYESFCMSFLTQLDPLSHTLVLKLIKEALLSNEKAVLKQGIPKPAENYLNFEGYWIQQGPQEIQECSNYILTESIRENLKDLSRIISIGKLPVLLQGPTSAGKTSLIDYVAKRSGNHCLRINNHEHTDLQEYIGTYAADEMGKLSFKEGILVQAMRNGYWIILDELNLASTDILEALNRVLDDNRELFIPETQVVIKAHPNFMLFATQNPPGLYGGRKTLSRAFKNRFIELHFSEIPRNELEIILEKRCLIPASYAKRMVACMSELQKNRKTTSKNIFTLRDLFRWGNRYTFADKKLLEDKLYDWNQHLIEEGYLVLSAKVRTDIEIEIIEETLYKTFKKRINLDRLFKCSNENLNSPVTNDIVKAITDFKERTDIVWTLNMTRMAVLTAKALQFDEPVLLVGPTGCGKTTVCQILASICGVKLRILNCHMHTEGADFLGGLRPCRQNEEQVNEHEINSEYKSNKLFEWTDGPLIHSMQEGSYFMADEISLAEDSVLERLNCILEPERMVLLAEKGGVADTDGIEKNFLIKAKDGFQFLATMNPGGDFGKKELSPALRNRFTEIWCLPSDSKEDLIQIANNCMLDNKQISITKDQSLKMATYLVEIVLYMKQIIEKFKFSIRDILAWANYIKKNENLCFAEKAIFGLETIFLDALEMLPYESLEKIELLKANILKFAISKSYEIFNEKFNAADVQEKRGVNVERTIEQFGIRPFYIPINSSLKTTTPNKDFLFDAPTTKKNLFRLLSALTLQKPILLEGPPGVGKTSIVESISQAIGYNIVRINLCEHTDLADLFGTDLPAEDNVLEQEVDINEDNRNIGSFVWRDGPLLAALKTENTWILLDELNLAPQSVLEGLNAILDHRGEVYIPELNKTFLLGKQTRIFACQNPLKQGGGRKGLPQSFLNRFNKVYLRKLTNADLLHVVNGKCSDYFEEIHQHFISLMKQTASANENNLFDLYKSYTKMETLLHENTDDSQKHSINTIEFDLSKRLVRFSELLDRGIAAMEFGYKGGPYEINLRDILRWCDLLRNPETGFIFDQEETFFDNFKRFLLILYERMKLVYYQRMRSEQDKLFIRNAFANVFNCDAEELNSVSEDISLYWTDEKIYLNDIVLRRDPIQSQCICSYKNKNVSPLLLSSQREILKNIIECVHMGKPVLLCGGTDSGKTKLIDTLCTLSGQVCNTDTIDDSVTGSFQQIDLNRHLEEIAQNVESMLNSHLQNIILENDIIPNKVADLMKLWSNYQLLLKIKPKLNNTNLISEELVIFRKRLHHLKDLIEMLEIEFKATSISNKRLKEQKRLIMLLGKHVDNSKTLNTGGSFEWVDSKIVKSLKYGQYISLEHINLCSSAVLDRLNPVFEPNGSLLISEKGVSHNDCAEIVTKAPNFRAFLTIDPKNGELSRAMRNRCIELSLTKNDYDEDDMRTIVYAHGIHNINAINCIMKIHERITHLTDMNTYNISHLTQCAFLTSSYQRIGYSLSHGIYVSSMEVYVYSAAVDLMGYGLSYYQNKLREIVIEETNAFKTLITSCDNIGNIMKNLIVNCSDMSAIALIKLQSTPLELVSNDTNNNMKNILKGFNQIEYDTQQQHNIMKFYLFLMYDSSAMDDVKMRYLYLKKILHNHTDLENISHQLFTVIQNFENHFPITLKKLPWNRKLYPRLRDYILCNEMDNVSKANTSSLTASLLMKILLQEMPAIQNALTNTNILTALQYSKAVVDDLVSDNKNNVFLKCLYPFLCGITDIVKCIFENNPLSVEDTVHLITEFLWVNRLLAMSQNKMLIGKRLNTYLLDKLILHFKWLQKYLLSHFECIQSAYYKINHHFELNLQEMSQFVLNTRHPFNLKRKLYTKHLSNFQPFYHERQLQLFTLMEEIDHLLTVVPNYGNYTPELLLRKYTAQQADLSKKCFAVCKAGIYHKFDYNFMQIELNYKSSDQISDHLKMIVQQFISNLEKENLEEDAYETIDYNEFKTNVESIKAEVNSADEFLANSLPNEMQLGMLPLREFYLNKVVSAKTIKDYDKKVNISYSEEIPSLSTKTWQLINILNTQKYENFQKMWISLQNYIKSLQSSEEFTNLIHFLNGIYRQFNSYARLLVNVVQNNQLSNLSSRFECTQIHNNAMDVNCNYHYNGPQLLCALFSLLIQNNGHLKPVALKDLGLWRNVLKEIQEILWHNSELMTPQYNELNNHLINAERTAKRLLVEMDYIEQLKQAKGNELNSEYNNNFDKLVDNLRETYTHCTTLNFVENQNDAKSLQQKQYYTSNLYVLIGSIELCLLTFVPLIDPVEKNRFKKEYLQEDIDNLKNLLNAYDMMRVVMRYKHLGKEIYEKLQKRLHCIQEKQKKFSKKVALRPIKCLYGSLVQDITHFLKTNCEPQMLNALITNVQISWNGLNGQTKATVEIIEKSMESIQKIDVWIANSQRFLNHILKKYKEYYQDIIQPLQCAIDQTRFGFEGLKTVQSKIMATYLPNQSGKIGLIYVNISEKLHRAIANIGEFPTAQSLEIFDVNSSSDILKNRCPIFSILEKIPGSEYDYFQLLKSKLNEICNFTTINGSINEKAFREFDFTLNVCNQVWQQEEDRRRQKQAENESLYVTKTKCETEDEEMQELQEIEENFPTNVEEDFGEFLQENSLEKVMRLDKKKDLKTKTIQILNADDYACLVRNFMLMNEQYTHVYYHYVTKPDDSKLEFSEDFKKRLQVFTKIYEHYKKGLNENLDNVFYNSFAYALRLQQNSLQDANMQENRNFYKDSNIPELITCLDLLSRIEEKVNEQLELYAEHAVLLDINKVIERIRRLPSTSPVVRFNTGFQILRQKLSQWNEVAHKNNNFRIEESEVASYVQKWTKLELQFWRNCLNYTNEKVETNAYKYWFFIYNLLQEYIQDHEVDTSLTDMKYTEKRFADEEILDPVDIKNKSKLSVDEIVRILRQFLEAANFGDFHVRMKLLLSFELYLHNIIKITMNALSEEKINELIAGFHNLQIYFSQFVQEIEEHKRNCRAPIEKKLKEFVKIESYNKDLSYFSMRNNVARVHRNLNKFIKEYEQELLQKITSVFQPKDATAKDYNTTNEKGRNMRYESKIKYNLLDVKWFIASEKLRKPTQAMEEKSELLLPKVDKLFSTCRNIVKESLTHCEYPKLIISLDMLFSEQLERCEHLRALQVDRTRERPHQISEAKQILQQKRKGLIDLFKTLAQLGISYRAGLMEYSLRTDFQNHILPPFNLKTMYGLVKDRHINPNLLQLNENLNTYYAKCVFKLKLLQNIMLTPLSELGPPNIERIKGFAIDFFLLVQEQRMLLAKSSKEIYDICFAIQNLKQIATMLMEDQHDANERKYEFVKYEDYFYSLKNAICRIRYVFEQFKLLMECMPTQCNAENHVLADTAAILKNSIQYETITTICQDILYKSKTILLDMCNANVEFLNIDKLKHYQSTLDQLVDMIKQIQENFKTNDNDSLPAVNCINSLLQMIENTKIENTINASEDINVSFENVECEIENILHFILLAFQKLYKKYTQCIVDKSDENKDDDSEEAVQEHHLKKKIFGELQVDWEILNISKIVTKMSGIMLTLKHSNASVDKTIYLEKVTAMLPILEQYHLMMEYYLLQQLASHKVSVKMLSVLLTVFVEIGTKGFCVPHDLMQDEEGQAKNDQKNGEGFGLEDGTGENDASDKLESEDQLDDAKRPEDRKDDDGKQDNCKEEKGIEMSEDFDGKMQDIEKPEDEEDDSAESENDEDVNKEMGETEDGADKLDEQIWGDDEEPEEDEEEKEMNEEDDGKGSKDEKDKHNDLDSKNETGKDDGNNNDDEDGLDATNEADNQEDKRKKQEKDIDDMKDQDVDEEQTNACHNELEEPPEAEDMDLGDMNNGDEDQENPDEMECDENPFDIDRMKENMQDVNSDEDVNDDQQNVDDDQDAKNENSTDEESEDENEVGVKTKNEDEQDENDDNEEVNNESETQRPGEVDPETNAAEEEDEKNKDEVEKHEEKPEEYEASKDKSSKEDNVQSLPETQDKGSADQVENDEQDSDIKQDQKLDEQETGEEKDGVGQADNENDDSGHQGIAETKETVSHEDRKQERETEKKRKQGRTNEERSLGEAEKNKLKQLKTIDKLKEDKEQITDEDNDNKDKNEADEYQHVKEPKNQDKTTLDNATEEQAKNIQHQQDEKEEDENNEPDECHNDLMEEDDRLQEEPKEDNLEEVNAEKLEQKSDKPSKVQKHDEHMETEEKIEIEGEVIGTMNVPRSDDTTAHCNKEVLMDIQTQAEEMSMAETLDMRKMYQQQLMANKSVLLQQEDTETWHSISNRMSQNARELCEQLRLILEPTKCTRLKGDYRTGRRINMRKIIPYIASQFRKDKIWLRRTKPAQRDYKITIAIDDSKSMHHNNSKILTLEAISLVSQALTLLESGRLSIVSFGESPKIILNHTEQFDGPKLVNSLNFEQGKTKIAELLDFIRISNIEDGNSGGDNGLFENLILILSDGRNIFSEGKVKVKNSIKLARLQRIFLVYVIIDNPDNKNSILDIQSMEVLPDKRINIKSYLDEFPFPYYVIVRDLNQLPLVLSEAMRQWFELVNSEQ